MSESEVIDERVGGRTTTEAAGSAGACEAPGGLAAGAEGPRLHVRAIEPVTIVRLEGCEILFDGAALRAVGERLHRLIDEGHIRLVVNLAGVRYAPSDLLGLLAG